MAATPQKRKYSIEDRGDTLQISIPTPIIWFYLVPWGGMLLVSLFMVASGEPVYVAGFGILGLLLIIWHFFRREVIAVSGQSIVIWEEVLGLRVRPKRYLADNARAVRLSTSTPDGLVAFDYGSAIVSFGKGLDVSGAVEIVAEIKRRFPQYQRESGAPSVQPMQTSIGVPGPLPGYLKEIKAPLPRHRSESIGNKLLITIPSEKKWFPIIFLTVWFVVWSIGGFFVWRAAVRGEGGLFVIVWLCFWIIFEIVGFYHLLWQLFGKEEIEVTADSMAIRQAILGIGRSTVYASQGINHMQVEVEGKVAPYALDSEGVSMSKGTGVIIFDYTGKKIKMGLGLNETEARKLVDEIQRYYPQYSK